MRAFVNAGLIGVVCVLGVGSLCVSSDAQSARAGIVTALEGSATVARVSLDTPAPLKFKDEIYTQDRITTDRDSLVRVLLGGKALLTIRERTVVTIREVPGAATIKVGSGRVRVDVNKAKMKAGEVVDIVTPNAVGTVRGTIVIAEVEGGKSTLTVLTGLIDVTLIDPASDKPVGPPAPLGALQQMTIVGTSPLPPPRRLTPDGAQQLGLDFKVPPKALPHGVAVSSDAAIKAGANAATAIVVPGTVEDGALKTKQSGFGSGGSLNSGSGGSGGSGGGGTSSGGYTSGISSTSGIVKIKLK